MLYGYARVSTKQQNLKRQVDALKEYGVKDRFIFTDKYTGKSLNREGLNELLEVIEDSKGHNVTLVLKELDRLGRNRQETKKLILGLLNKGVDIVCLDMPYINEFVFDKIKDSKEDGFVEIMANALLDIVLEVANQERLKIVNRTKEGRKKAVEQGVQFGRKRKVNLEEFEGYYKRFLSRELKAVEIQNELGISKQCYYNYVERLKNKEKEREC